MPLIVKPISAMLVKDKDTFDKSVSFHLRRILMLSFWLETKNKDLELVKVEVKNLFGLII